MKSLWIIPVLSIFIACSQPEDTLIVKNLRCEYLENPMGIDVPQPRLSWTLESKDRGKSQSAYRIIVSSPPKRFSNPPVKLDRGDLWDSGKVKSSQTNNIVYKGKKLKSGDTCFWTVYVWDEKGSPVRLAGHSYWSMGPMEKSDWKASWIGMDRKTPPAKNKKSRSGPARDLFQEIFHNQQIRHTECISLCNRPWCI